MKKLMLAWVLLSVLLTACDDSSDVSDKPNPAIAEIQSTVVNGEWRATKYIDSGSDATANLVGYLFDFDSNGVLTVTNGSENYMGTWSVSDDESGDDDAHLEDVDFNLSFTNPPLFEEISEDWQVVSRSSTKLELRHVSGGNVETDQLVLEKI